MKINMLKIFAIATLMIFFGAGVSLADDWKGDGGRRGYADGHYKHGGYPHYQYSLQIVDDRVAVTHGIEHARAFHHDARNALPGRGHRGETHQGQAAADEHTRGSAPLSRITVHQRTAAT